MATDPRPVRIALVQQAGLSPDPERNLGELLAEIDRVGPRADFIMPTEQGPDETNDVLVAAVRNEKLDFYREVAKRAGLKLLRVGLRPAANRCAVNKFLAATPQKRVLFVDVGPTTTEIDVFLDGNLVFSRAADVAIPDEPAAEDSSSDADGGPVLSIKVDLTGDVRMQAVVGELLGGGQR